VVEAALADLATADIDERLRATLFFLDKLTLEPNEVDESDVDAVVAAGVTPDALRDAIEVAAAFNVIDRIADALDFELQSPEALAAGAKQLSTRGYA
jgi:alkylhydroperoxidase family enzyme